MSVASVLYMEEDVYERRQLKPQWEEFFKTAGVSATVEFADNIDIVMSGARDSRCDVFICDLSLNNESENSWGGLGLLARVKKSFPEVLTIGTTSGNPTYRTIDVHEHRFDIFIPKPVLRNGNFRKSPDYVERLRSVWRIVPKFKIEITGSVVKPLEGEAPSAEKIVRLVRQLFAGRPPVDVRTVPESVSLTQLSGGRSTSSVFAMRPREDLDCRRFIPSIVKVSPIEEHHQELERYQQFIKWSLPYTVRVDFLGASTIENWGAIAYSFAHGGRKFDSLTEILQSRKLDRAKNAIDNVFHNASDFWAPLQWSDPTWSLRGRYFNRYFNADNAFFQFNYEQVLQAALEAGLHFVERARRRVEVAGTSFPQPVQILTEFSAPAQQSLCHGDLNSNNLIVAEDGSVALIDFRDAGIGHVFEDIITLEGCVRLFWDAPICDPVFKPEELFKKLLARERSLIAKGSCDGTSEAWCLIEHIRSKAYASFPEQNSDTYIFGLAYYSFRLLRIRPLSQIVTLRLLASLMASCEALGQHR